MRRHSATSRAGWQSLTQALRTARPWHPHFAADVAVNTAWAYATLHDHGYLHGDVHPGNVLVDDDGTVTLIDFATAVPVGQTGPGAGVPAYHEPELAGALLQGGSHSITPRGEQYSVATIILEALLGHHPITLPLDTDGCVQAIACQTLPLPWP